MEELFKEHPFKIAGAVAAAGIAAGIGLRWWAILVLLVVGFVLGAFIDASGNKGVV